MQLLFSKKVYLYKNVMKYAFYLSVLLLICSTCRAQNHSEHIQQALNSIAIKDYVGAFRAANKAVEVDPFFAEAYHTRALVEVAQGKYSAAIYDENKAIKYKPIAKIFPACYFNRGLAKYQLGDITGGCADLSKSGEMGYSDAYVIIREYCN